MRRIVAIVFALGAVLYAAGPVYADDTLSVVAGAPTTGFYDLLEDVAAAAGFYKEAHLDVTKNYAGGASAAAQLVASGKIDVCTLSAEPVLEGYEKGLRLRYFLSRQSTYSYVLAVPADSSIRTLADFKGKQIAEPTPASPVEVVVDSLLGGAGLKRSDYSFAPVGYGAANLQALVSKRVDGTSDIYSNLVTNEVKAHVAYRIFRDPILDTIANVGYAALPATIDAKADVLQRFARAIDKAAVFVRADPQAAARIYLKASGERVTDDALADTTRIITLVESELPGADPSSRRIGSVPASGLELYSRELVQYGFATQVVPAATVATNRFIAYANDFDRKPVQALAHSLH
jgi:NitT/TauT family transport system substrate-binding protein